MASDSSALPRVTFQTPEKPEEESSHRKLGKLTIKYNRKDLQRWLELEEWINTQLQELYQYQLREETEVAVPEPEIDLEDLLEVPNEEQKLKLQEILHECSSPTETTAEQEYSPLAGENSLLYENEWGGEVREIQEKGQNTELVERGSGISCALALPVYAYNTSCC
ncbi:protein phosphatase 1 regulatory subunit 14D isoform X1 [Struthio camelus]|uniref:protein phosphatase 1 regulatory subunit 14D isoform X1 n=1 Tax=Struthio camelus TaxID=8801 RepID=UPI003603F135